MRFYHKLAQFYLVYHFGEVVHSGRAKDEGFLGLAKWARDVELSKKKQAIGNDVISQLYALSYESIYQAHQEQHSALGVDEFTKQQLTKLIETYDEKVGKAISGHSAKNKGASVDAVNNANKLLLDIENLCKEMGLWERDYDERDPLMIFQYQMALYICSKFNSTDTFGLKKAKVAREKLLKATQIYHRMETAPLNEKIDFIRERIDATKTANELLCAQHPQGVDLPINLTFLTFNLSPQFVPSVGTLEKMLDTALDKLNDLEQSLLKGLPTKPSQHSSTYKALHGLGHTDHDPITPQIDVFTNPITPSLDGGSPRDSDKELSIMEAISLGKIARMKELFAHGFNLHTPITPRKENPLEFAMAMGKLDVVVAITEHFKNDPNNNAKIEEAFQKACDNKNWRAAQAIDQEQALAKQLDQQFNGQLHWYSFNNTRVKARMMQAAEKLVGSNPKLNAASFYKHMSESSTAKWRQFKFWTSVPTNTTDFFIEKAVASEIYGSSHIPHGSGHTM